MKKSELITFLFEGDDIKYKAIANRMLKKIFIDAVEKAIKNDEDIIRLGNDIGSLKIKKVKGRSGMTFGKEWKTDDRIVVRFKPSKKFIKNLNK